MNQRDRAEKKDEDEDYDSDDSDGLERLLAAADRLMAEGSTAGGVAPRDQQLATGELVTVNQATVERAMVGRAMGTAVEPVAAATSSFEVTAAGGHPSQDRGGSEGGGDGGSGGKELPTTPVEVVAKAGGLLAEAKAAERAAVQLEKRAASVFVDMDGGGAAGGAGAAVGASDWRKWIASSPPFSPPTRHPTATGASMATIATERAAEARARRRLVRQLKPLGICELNAMWDLDPDRAAQAMRRNILRTQGITRTLISQLQEDWWYVRTGKKISAEGLLTRKVWRWKLTAALPDFPIVYPRGGNLRALVSFAEALMELEGSVENFINTRLHQEGEAEPGSRPGLTGLGTTWTRAIAAEAGDPEEWGGAGGRTMSENRHVGAEAATTDSAALRLDQAAFQAASFFVTTPAASGDSPSGGPEEGSL